MITVEFTEEVTKKAAIEPGYYKDEDFHYYLNGEGELLCIARCADVVYDLKAKGREKRIAGLVNCTPSTREDFYQAYEAARQIRSSILSK